MGVPISPVTTAATVTEFSPRTVPPAEPPEDLCAVSPFVALPTLCSTLLTLSCLTPLCLRLTASPLWALALCLTALCLWDLTALDLTALTDARQLTALKWRRTNCSSLLLLCSTHPCLLPGLCHR